MFAVETKQKKKRKCVHAKLCSERASFILSESLTLKWSSFF